MQYALRIIGFDVRGVRLISRQIRRSHFNVDPSVAKMSGFVQANEAKRAPEKNL